MKSDALDLVRVGRINDVLIGVRSTRGKHIHSDR